MVKPNIKYRVTLTSEERAKLEALIKKGRTAGYRIRHARILLALDEIPANAEWMDRKIAQTYGSNLRTIGILRKRFVEEGFQAALERKKRDVPPCIKIDGEAEAKIIEVKVTESRTRKDFAWCLRDLAEQYYPDARKIVLVA